MVAPQEGAARRTPPFVTPDPRLKREMRNRTLQNPPRHQPRAGIIEMQHLLTTRRLSPCAAQIETVSCHRIHTEPRPVGSATTMPLWHVLLEPPHHALEQTPRMLRTVERATLARINHKLRL